MRSTTLSTESRILSESPTTTTRYTIPPTESASTTESQTTTTSLTTPLTESPTTTESSTTTSSSTTPPTEATTTTETPPTTISYITSTTQSTATTETPATTTSLTITTTATTSSTTPTTESRTTTETSTTPKRSTPSTNLTTQTERLNTLIQTTPCSYDCEWSEWYDVHDSRTDGNDLETYKKIKSSGRQICENPKEIDCRSAEKPEVDLKSYLYHTGQVVKCDVRYGLICKQKKQKTKPFKCLNYKIRVCCEVPCSTTIITTTELTTTTEIPRTTTGSTTKPTESTTITEPPTTTQSSSTTRPTTPPTESTTTHATTPTTSTNESTTTTQQTPTELRSTTETFTTTTASTTPTTELTITTESPTTTTSSERPPTESTTTTQAPTTPTTSTTETPTTATTESSNTTQSSPTTRSTTLPTEFTTIQAPTTPTTSTTESITTTQQTTTELRSTRETFTTSTSSTTSTIELTTTSTTFSSQSTTSTTTSTTPPTESTATTETQPTTTGSTAATVESITSTEQTTTESSPYTTHPTESTTTTQSSSTTPPTESTTITEGTTNELTTTAETLITSRSTAPLTELTITPESPTTTTRSTTPPTESTTRTVTSSIVLSPTSTTSTAPQPTESTSSAPTTSQTESTTATEITTSAPRMTSCHGWGVVQNETFYFCNCTIAKCIENNILEIVPYECPPTERIACTNGKEPLLVYDEHHCCQRYVCDCVCEGWGNSHYITFDGLHYSYQGNCTYVLMEEITGTHDLKIYIDNVYCDPNVHVSCPRSMIVFYGSQVVQLTSHNPNGTLKLEALKNTQSLKLPYAQQGVKIINSGKNLIFEIPDLKVAITFGRTGFGVTLPFEYFGNNTQGLCGTCTNNQADDCMLPGGTVEESCAVMADDWSVKDNKMPNCMKTSAVQNNTSEPTLKSTPCRNDSMCNLLTSRQSVFAECHKFVSPDNFYKGCIFDSCHVSNHAMECTSLETYAAACAQAGVCVHWRDHASLCASDCPSDKVYKACGPAQQPTCEDNTSEVIMNFMTEGCYCPEGMKLFNKHSNICVEKCGCLDPDGIARAFNERFEYKCQDCICEESRTMICTLKMCPAPSISSCNVKGFVLVNQTNPLDPCCFDHICQCQMDTCPVSKMVCPIGYRPVVSVPKGKCCPEHTCETNRVCVHGDIAYQENDTWSSPLNRCEHYTCVRSGGTLTTMRSTIPCPPFSESNCQPGTIQVEANGCCKTCVEKEKGCKMSFEKTFVTHKYCQSTKMVNMPYCEGSCNTSSKYSLTASALQHSCSCCKESRFSNRTIDLLCLNGETIPYTYMHVEQCSCGQTDCTRTAARRGRSYTLM